MLFADHNATCKSFSHTALMLYVTTLQEDDLTLSYHVNPDIMHDFTSNFF